MNYYKENLTLEREPEELDSYLHMLNQRHADNWRQLIDFLENITALKPSCFKLSFTKEGTILIVPEGDEDALALEFDL